MTTERVRQQSLADQLAAYLRAHEGAWVPMRTLAQIGGIGGWRTRLSELSRRGMPIEWNRKNGAASAHRYVAPAPSDQQHELF